MEKGNGSGNGNGEGEGNGAKKAKGRQAIADGLVKFYMSERKEIRRCLAGWARATEACLYIYSF